MKFSLITVVKNNKFQISKTINSIKEQNYKNFEYIVIDGNSTDGTTEIIKKLNKNYRKLKHIIRKDKNLYDGLNFGIKVSKGKYIVILHSGDSFFSKNTLAVINKNILNYDAISGNVLFSKNGKIVRYWNYNFKKLNKFNSFKIAHTALIVKKEIIKKLNFYDLKYSISSDTDFVLRMSQVKGLKFKKIEKTIVLMNVGGLSNSYENLLEKIYQDLKIYFKNFNLLFLFIYSFKIFFKFYKLIKWKILN